MKKNGLHMRPFPSRQSGAVLIVALVLLLVLTVLGVSGIQDTLITERMTGNFRDSSLAFEAAEAELRRWEREMDDASFDFDASGITSYAVSDSSLSVDPGDPLNYGTMAYTSSLPLDFSSLSANPRYYLERLPPIPAPNSSLVVGFPETAPTVQYFRITTKGFGLTPASEVILQSTFLGPL
ncbi:MAG: PilX N-terminal domain-containing pilus assembly protein [Sedimenticolaceae bacterium]